MVPKYLDQYDSEERFSQQYCGKESDDEENWGFLHKSWRSKLLYLFQDCYAIAIALYENWLLFDGHMINENYHTYDLLLSSK